VPELKLREIQQRLKEVDNAALEDVLSYLEYDKLMIVQNIAKKVNSVNESDSMNYMSWAISRLDWLYDTLKKCIKKENKPVTKAD